MGEDSLATGGECNWPRSLVKRQAEVAGAANQGRISTDLAPKRTGTAGMAGRWFVELRASWQIQRVWLVTALARERINKKDLETDRLFPNEPKSPTIVKALAADIKL